MDELIGRGPETLVPLHRSTENASSSPLVTPSRTGILDAFQNRSFRFQWPSDGLTIWAFEMETLILGWYILTATDSPALVGLIAALRFAGTIFGPIYGALTDKFNRRRLLIAGRATLAVIALSLIHISEPTRPY